MIVMHANKGRTIAQCLENGLSVIKTRKPSEREKYTDCPKSETKRAKINEDIETILSRQPKDFEELLYWMREDYDSEHIKVHQIVSPNLPKEQA